MATWALRRSRSPLGLGAPCLAYGTLLPQIRALVDFHVNERAPRHDISAPIGFARNKMEINDFKRDTRRIMPRYAVLITPHGCRAETSRSNCGRAEDWRTRRAMGMFSARSGGYMDVDLMKVAWDFRDSCAIFARCVSNILTLVSHAPTTPLETPE